MLNEIINISSYVLGVYGIVVFTMIGFVFVDRKVFGYCMYLLFLTMIYNTILKNIFQMPLPETCPSTGFGFPSGHAHFYSVFYFWVMVHYKHNIFRIVCFIMWAFSCFRVVYLGYHYAFDVFAASVFALVSVLLYKNFVESKMDFYKISLFSIILAVFFATETGTLLAPRTAMIPVLFLLVFYTFLTWFFIFKREILKSKLQIVFYIFFFIALIHALFFRTSIVELQSHIYLAFYFIVGMFLGEIFAKGERPIRLMSNLSSFLAIVCFYHITKYLFSFWDTDFQFLKQLMWLCFSFSIPLSTRLTNACFSKQ